jgi:hypothetical protein
MEIYSHKLLEISPKNASLTWGDGLFTNQTPRLIQELTQADGYMTSTGRLTANGKMIIQKQIHSKILAFQILTMLSNDACKVIKCQSDEYTWKDANGLNEEMDGMIITALILWCLQPLHKVDIHSEIGTVKKMTIAQYTNDIISSLTQSRMSNFK